MSGKFLRWYRVPSARASWWNYGNDGAYYVTLCTRNRLHYFGEIRDGIMYPSQVGSIADKHWKEIPNRFAYVRLGEFILMPNHIHGIIIIQKEDIDNGSHAVSKANFSSPFNRGGITSFHNPMLHQNLSRVMRWFTARVTYDAHKINPTFNWQRRFYDHIIRDMDSYDAITNYIRLNPLKWEEDEFYID